MNGGMRAHDVSAYPVEELRLAWDITLLEVFLQIVDRHLHFVQILHHLVSGSEIV
jgi:hypothetical protein